MMFGTRSTEFAVSRLRAAGRPSWLLILAVVVTPFLFGCSTNRDLVPQGTTEPDRFLFERGSEELKEENWVRAREYFRALVDGYPQSPHRPDGKIGVGDTYIGENTVESLVLAINEFREFLAFFPTHMRADYAQAQLAFAHYKQMRGPQRDQTETKEAIKEYEFFLERYPNSALMPDVKAKLREARDRFSEYEYSVGFFYFRTRWYPGAIDRFRSILKNDPEYTNRDAVYFHLAEALLRTDKKAEALPYYERVLKEFERSEYLIDARKRVAELQSEPPPPSGSAAR
jgi:outer membrane protein assembly factor BamD